MGKHSEEYYKWKLKTEKKTKKKDEKIYGVDVRYLEVLLLYITFISFSVANWKDVFGEFSFQLIFVSLVFSTFSLISAFISNSVMRFRKTEFLNLGFKTIKFEEYFCRVSTASLFTSVGFLSLSLLLGEIFYLFKIIILLIFILILVGVKIYEKKFVN